MESYLTIRQTVATGKISERFLRLRLKQGQLPGIYSGNRFLVNVDALEEMLRAESMKMVKKQEAE